MKKLLVLLMAVGIVIASSGLALAVNWNPWAVHDGSTVANIDGSVTFTGGGSLYTWSDSALNHGAKAYYSTDYFNGMAVSILDTLTYAGDPVYTNIYVTDGTHRAILAANMTNNIDFSEVLFSIYENDGIGLSGTALTWDDVKGLTIANGPYASQASPQNGWASWDAHSDGLALVWGNRSGDIAYGNATTISDLRVNGMAVPEPATMLLLGLGLVGLAGARRKLKK